MLKIQDVTVQDTVANQSTASGDARRPVAASRPAMTVCSRPGPRDGRQGLSIAPSWRSPGQIPNPDQVVHGQRKGEHPADAPAPRDGVFDETDRRSSSTRRSLPPACGSADSWYSQDDGWCGRIAA